MGNFLGNMVKGSTDITDDVIANTMIGGTAGAANAYLNAALATATPELRAMYAATVNDMMAENTAITGLALKKGWEKPYDTPTQQLNETLQKSKHVVKDRV